MSITAVTRLGGLAAMKPIGRIVVLVSGVIAATSSASADGSTVTAGRELFASRSVACHGLRPTRKPGPPIAGIRTPAIFTDGSALRSKD